MADTIVNMVLDVRQPAKTAYEGSGTVYKLSFTSEDNAFSWQILFGAGAPSTNYTDAPTDSLYIDTTNHMLYYKTAADTWAEIGDVT